LKLPYEPSVEAAQEEKKKRKRIGKGRTGRQVREEEEVFGSWDKQENSKITCQAGREIEKILEKLEEMKDELRASPLAENSF
jgi:hypothetical protein